jgi:hypothetical protein
VSQGCTRKTDAKGIEIMGTTELQGPSKRIRIVLCMLVAFVATAALPAAGLAADWTSQATPNADWTS